MSSDSWRGGNEGGVLQEDGAVSQEGDEVMCNYASAVLTETDDYWLPNDDSHEAIIAHHKLKADRVGGGSNVLRVELLPTDQIKVWPSVEL